MVWSGDGFLVKFFGIKDFAGGTVVHMSAGFAALAGALMIGKRKNDHHEPSNITYVILGTGMLWFGWFGFNSLFIDRKSTRLNSSHITRSRMPSSA